MSTRGDSWDTGDGVRWPAVLALALAAGLGLGMPVPPETAELKPILAAVLCLAIGALSDGPLRAWLGGLLLAAGHLMMCRLVAEPCDPLMAAAAGALAYGPVAAMVSLLIRRPDERYAAETAAANSFG